MLQPQSAIVYFPARDVSLGTRQQKRVALATRLPLAFTPAAKETDHALFAPVTLLKIKCWIAFNNKFVVVKLKLMVFLRAAF